MSPKPTYHLGINLGFAINRFPEPEAWIDIVSRELGLTSVQFVADLLNPFLPTDYVTSEARRIRELTDRAGIRVTTTFTSAFTRVNHLMHPDPRIRAIWLDWFRRWVGVTAILGAEATGSHFGILSVRECDDTSVRSERVEGAVRAWQEISRYAASAGLRYLLFEPMSIPRENAWTIEETLELRERVNRDAAIPMEVCLDVGHAPHPDQRDPYPWLERVGTVSPVVHLQQTERDHSRHWPFTEECNRLGMVDAERVLSILDRCGRSEVHLLFEIGHRERWPDDTRVVPDLVASVAHWREALAGRASG
jgi:sugar phosphate isomerase/epimerase